MSEFVTVSQWQCAVDPETPGIWGLGDHYSTDLFIKNGIYGQWNRDDASPKETGTLPTSNTYGTHPYFMFKSKSQVADEQFVGIYYHNFAASDYYVSGDANEDVIVTSAGIGGRVDFFVTWSATPEQTVRQYHKIIGTPVTIPRWSLGWNQAKWGWIRVQDINIMVNKYKENNIPLDGIFPDIPYMNDYEDFTVDSIAYVNATQFSKDWSRENIHLIPIVDAGVAVRNNTLFGYEFFQNATKADIFLKAPNGEPFIGEVWPVDASFIDYNHPNATDIWVMGLESLNKQFGFDGIWLDMNEASNFCTGYCYDS